MRSSGRRALAGWLALLAVSLAPATRSQTVVELDNGLQVIVKENHAAPVAAFRLYVRTGSIYEQEYLGYGISHVFEHLISGGTTKNRSEKEIKELLERLGNANNAYTTRDHTCYFITTSADKIGEAVDLMADWMINSTFPEVEVKREMQVVFEELTKGKEEPRRAISKALYRTMYQKHPVREPVIGHESLVKKITRDDILRYYQRMYAPNNMLAVAVGDFDADAVLAQIKTAFASFERRALPSIALPPEPQQMGERVRVVEKEGLGGAYFRIGFHSVPLQHPDLYALDVLSYILSHGRSSRLVKTIREEKRLVSSIGSYSHTPSYAGGIFGIYGAAAPDKVEPALAATLEEVFRLRSQLVTSEELAKAKRQKIADDVLYRQTAVDEAEELASNVLSAGNPKFDEVYLRGIKAVTREQVRGAAQKYLYRDNMTTVTLRPKQPAAVAADKRPGDDPFPVRKLELPNGMRLLLKRNPNVPLVNVQVLFLGGVRLEPAAKAGISRITARLLTRGSANRTSAEIAAAFDGMGGRLSQTAGNNTFGLNAEVLKDDFPQALEIIADILAAPAFAEEEFKTVKMNTLTAIARQNDSWQSELYNHFRRAFFTSHPYQRPALGLKETVEKLTPADARAFYQRLAVARSGVVTVFGDIDVDQTAKAVTAALGGLLAKDAPAANVPAEPPATADRMVRLEVKRQLSAIYLGYQGLSIRDDKDRYAMVVLDAVLSGIGYPGGRLHERLRGQRQGLVYLVHAYNFFGLEPGFFGITAAASPAKMDEVQRIILEEVAKIRREPVGAAELAKAKAMCITMEKLSRQTNADMALQAGLDELYGMGYAHHKQYEPGIKAVAAADVQRVAQKYLGHHVTVLTGPPPAATSPAPTGD